MPPGGCRDQANKKASSPTTQARAVDYFPRETEATELKCTTEFARQTEGDYTKGDATRAREGEGGWVPRPPTRARIHAHHALQGSSRSPSTT